MPTSVVAAVVEKMVIMTATPTMRGGGSRQIAVYCPSSSPVKIVCVLSVRDMLLATLRRAPYVCMGAIRPDICV